MSANINSDEIVLDVAPSVPSPLLLPQPRALWIEFLLHFSTFGLYTSYWFVRRMQEFKRMYTTDSRPWLWIFVPIFVIAQLVALPRFVGLLNRFERESGVSEWRAWHGGWYLLVILLTVGFNVSDKYELPWWFLPLGLISWAVLFTVIQQRIDSAKRNQISYGFLLRRRALAMPEVLVLLITIPGILFLLFVWTKDEIFDNTLEELEQGSVYIDKKYQFKLPIQSEGWRKMEVGTHSNGDAELELQGVFSGMYFIVFSHSVDSTLNDIVFARQNEIMEETPTSECRQLRMLSSGGDSVIAKVICTSKLLNNHVLNTVTVIETSTSIVEMYGNLTTVQNSFKEYRAEFEKMAAGLEPL